MQYLLAHPQIEVTGFTVNTVSAVITFIQQLEPRSLFTVNTVYAVFTGKPDK